MSSSQVVSGATRVSHAVAKDPLTALLAPRSIALVGASDRPRSVGHAMVLMSRAGGYAGRIYAVNPRLTEIEGVVESPKPR